MFTVAALSEVTYPFLDSVEDVAAFQMISVRSPANIPL